jgi:hypothetical protein
MERNGKFRFELFHSRDQRANLPTWTDTINPPMWIALISSEASLAHYF